MLDLKQMRRVALAGLYMIVIGPYFILRAILTMVMLASIALLASCGLRPFWWPPSDPNFE